MSPTIQLDTDVLAVLTEAHIEGRVLKLVGQLPRPLYVKVDKALNALGGKWNRKAGGHLFEDDPACVVAEALVEGSVTDPIKLYQFYRTPDAIARQLVALAQIGDLHRTLEPSAGDGAILDALQEGRDGEVDACEINPKMHADLLRRPGVSVVGTDFLTYTPGQAYDRIVANPPFAKQQDIIHANHMLDLLKPGGRLVVILSAGVLFREDRRTKEFRRRLEQECPGHEFMPLPTGAFKESGTMVNAVVLAASKPQ